jgi:hypothetical protein
VAASRNPSSVFGCDEFDVPLEQETVKSARTKMLESLFMSLPYKVEIQYFAMILKQLFVMWLNH